MPCGHGTFHPQNGAGPGGPTLPSCPEQPPPPRPVAASPHLVPKTRVYFTSISYLTCTNVLSGPVH